MSERHPQSRPNSLSQHFTLSWTYPLKACFTSPLAPGSTLTPIFQGIYFFATHRFLWPLLTARLIPLSVLSLFVTLVLFLFTYLPQVALLAVFHRSGSAWVNGTFLVLSEASLLVAIFFEAFFVDKTQVDIVDAVLVSRGHIDLVQSKRLVDTDADQDPVACLGPRDKGAEYAPFSFRQIIEFVILLPLNLVPYAGVPLFLLATGARAGPLQQWRYYNLKGFDKKQRRAFIARKSMRWELTWFGSVALFLQLIPVLSLFFLLTTAAGTGIWAADIEDKLKQARDHGDEAGAVAYTDEV